MMRLYNDCCMNILPTIEADSIDMVMTSPPYDALRTYKNGDDFTFDTFRTISTELVRVLKPGCVIVWNVGDGTTKEGSESGMSFRQALYFMSLGLNLYDTLIWDRESSAQANNYRYWQCFDYMFVFSKGRPKTRNLICDRPNKHAGKSIHGTIRLANGLVKRQISGVLKQYGRRTAVWRIPGEKNNKSNHPAVYPVAIPRDHIISWSNPGDTVLDPFLGSGTTAIAAHMLGRQFIGIERDAEYFNNAKHRILTSKG